MKNNAFISYSRKDKAFVQQLVAAFNADGRDVWIDWEDIPLTADWKAEIRAGIEGANDFIFIISPDSVQSEVCSEELAMALEYNKRLVPVLYREVTDYRAIHNALSSHNWIIFNNPDEFDKAFQGLLRALDTDLEYTRAHTALLQRALEWERKNKPASLLLRGQDLREYETWLGTTANKVPAVTVLQNEFIAASRKRAAQLQRMLISVLTLGFIVSAALALVAIASRNEAAVARNQAQTQAEIAVQNAATATIAQGQAEDAAALAAARASDIQSLLLADTARQEFGINPPLAIALGLVANNVNAPPAQAQRTLADIGYAPGVQNLFTGFGGTVTSVTFSADRRLVAAGSYDGTVSVWEIQGGARVFNADERTVQAVPVKSVALSPDATRIAAGLLDGSVLVWDVASGDLLYHLGGIRRRSGHVATVNTLTFSADGQLLISGGSDDVIILWDMATGEESGQLVSHQGDVNALALHPDGIHLYSASDDRLIMVWNLETRKLEKPPFTRHGAPVTALSISPDGRFGLSASENNDLVLWDAQTGNSIRPLGEAFGAYRIVSSISGVGFTPDGGRAVSTSLDGRLIVWNLVTYKGEHVLSTGSAPLTSVAVAGDGRRVLTGSSAGASSQLILWEIDNGAVQGYLEGHQDGLTSVAYHPDGRTVATGGDDFNVIIWDASTYDILYVLEGHRDKVRDVAYSPDGRLLVSGGNDGNLVVWDVSTGEQLNTMSVGTARVNVLVFMPDNQTVIAGLDNSTILLLNAETGEQIGELVGHRRRILSLALSQDGATLVSGSAGGELIQWKMSDRTITRRLQGQSGRIQALAFHPDGQHIVTGADNGSILRWNLATGSIEQTFDNVSDGVSELSFNHNGRYLLSGDFDGVVKLWDAESGESIRIFAGIHTAPVLGVAFSPDGKNAASASRDRTGIIWHMPPPAGLIYWIRNNRYVPELSCSQKLLYRITSECLTQAEIDSAIFDYENAMRSR